MPGSRRRSCAPRRTAPGHHGAGMAGVRRDRIHARDHGVHARVQELHDLRRHLPERRAHDQEVERMRRRYRQLVRVEVPHDGPTCKADCLNWIVQAIFAQNEKQPEPFAGVILRQRRRAAPAGTEVLQLPAAAHRLHPIARDLAGARLARARRRHSDEFAEWHTKDLVVRESLSKMVPSAGVGTCFSRRALMELAAETNNQPFNTDTLTEDYDIGARLAQRGMRQIFGKFPVEYVARRRSWFGLGPEKVTTLSMPLGVREYFPNTFRTAYRQKARWTLGIGLQGWQQVGWTGSFATRYLLFRDRRAWSRPSSPSWPICCWRTSSCSIWPTASAGGPCTTLVLPTRRLAGDADVAQRRRAAAAWSSACISWAICTAGSTPCCPFRA